MRNLSTQTEAPALAWLLANAVLVTGPLTAEDRRLMVEEGWE
jgi:hypothetical protein